MKTGYEDWDQNLKTLSQSLFPDPSKAAHAYYYGAEARKAQLDAAKTQDQMAAGHTALGMQFGRVPNPTYQPGFGGTQIMVDPNAQPAPSPAPGPTGLGAAVTAMPPQAVAHGVVAGVENNAQSGTLPPMAPPTPSSPPAPTTTASNGTTPSNSPATLHPGSVTSAGGGGVIMAGPAAADGTPAPAAFNMGQLIALQIAAGATPDAAYATARGTLGNMVKNGQIALPLAEQMAAFYGAPSMRNQTIANEGALAVGAQTQAGETARNTARIAGDMARQQVVTGEARRADEFAPEKTVDENVNAIFVSRKDTPGKRAYDSTLANTVLGKQAEYGTFVDPTNPTKTIEITKGRAAALGLQPAPTGQDAVTALGTSAIMNAPPDQAADVRARVQFAQPPAKPVDANETAKKQFLIDQQLDKMMPVPSGMHPFLNTNPAAASPEFGPVLTDLADQYFNNSTDKTIRNDPIAAANAALKQMVRQGYINLNQDRSIGYYPGGETSYLQKPVFDKAGNIVQHTPRFKVDIINPVTKKPYAPTEVPARIPMAEAGGAVPAAGAAKGGSLGPAPPGVPEGGTVYGPDGKPAGVNRGGQVYER